MAPQEEGWPLVLQPLNARIGLAGNRDNSGSMSFNTFITGSPSFSSSTDSSSDLDTESTGSFFPDKSRTLGSILELSRRPLREVKAQVLLKRNDKAEKSKWRSWLVCSCWRSSLVDAGSEEKEKNVASLGRFLAEERKAAIENRRNQSIPIYGPDDEFALAQTQNMADSNSLFVNGSVAPPITGCIQRDQHTSMFSYICVRVQAGPG